MSVVGVLRKSLRPRSTDATILRLAASFLLLSAAVLFAFGCGQGVRDALPGSYHDNEPRVYWVIAILYGVMSAGFTIATLNVISSLFTVSADRSPRISGCAAALLTPACALPYDQILDRGGTWAINALIVAGTIGLGAHSLISTHQVETHRSSLET